MRRLRRGRWIVPGLMMAFLGVAVVQPVMATTSRSTGYEVSEAEFGAGAALEACSGSYCARATIGSLSADGASSGTFTAAFGPLSAESEPLLEVMVEPGVAFLGELDTETTASRTMRLHVRSHLAGGYQVQMLGDPPRYGDHVLAAPAAPTAAAPGTEQFAINVATNTTPEVGEDPLFTVPEDEIPGLILPDYATPNLFAYRSGDVVARTYAESSQIRYTISMIVNVSGSTPAGHYAGDFSAVVTPVF